MTQRPVERPKHALWLENKFIEWRAKQTSPKAGIKEFVAYLGVDRNNYNSLVNRGSKPTGVFLEQLAEKFGNEIYTILDLPLPDENWLAIKRLYASASPHQRAQMRVIAEQVVNGVSHSEVIEGA